jgi:hypothetical protein
VRERDSQTGRVDDPAGFFVAVARRFTSLLVEPDETSPYLKTGEPSMNQLIRTMSIGFFAVLTVVLVGCGNQYKDKVIGTWDTTMPFNPRITFAKDGTGSMTVNVGNKSATKQFTWRLNGNNLILNLDGKDSGGLIKSADENKIVLNDPDVKADFTFTRVKK